MKVSIVTVNKNSGYKLMETYENIVSLKGNSQNIRIEWILVDGLSKDISKSDLINLNADILVHELDSNLYDAMNKGLAKSTGEIVYFLNSGDVISKFDVFLNMCSEVCVTESWLISPIFMYESVEVYESRRISLWSNKLAKVGLRPLPHQGAIWANSFLKKNNLVYNVQVGLCADQIFMVDSWEKKRPVIKEDAFCLFKLDGIGSQQPVGSFAKDMYKYYYSDKNYFKRFVHKLLSNCIITVLKAKIQFRFKVREI